MFELFDVYWMGAYSIDDFIYLSLTYGTPFDITSASWFIVMLFFVIVSYSITRAIFEAFWNDLFFLFIFILIGCCSIYLTHTNIVNIQYMILPLKIMFFLQFYQLGYCYYKYNNAFNILNKYKLFFALSFLLSIFIHFFYSNSDITYNSLAFMQSFKTNNFILPFITATIGILFYLCLSECLIAILGNNYIVNLISNNTLIILISHLFCFNIINLGVLYGNVFNDFNKSVFYSSSWYVYGNNNGILWLYLLFGLFGPIVFSYSLSKFYKYIVSRIIKVYSSVKNL